MVILPLFDGVMTIEVNGGAHGGGAYYDDRKGQPGSDGQIQLIPSVSAASHILFVFADDNLNFMLSYIYMPTNHPFLSLLS